MSATRVEIRKVRAFADIARSGRGGALVVVMAVVTAVLLIGSALFALGVGEGGVVDGVVDDARAFYLAEAGLARGRTQLETLAGQSPRVYPGDFTIAASALGEGSYAVEVDQRATLSPWVHEYGLISTGTLDGVSATVRAIVRDETFAQYMWYTSVTGDAWFTTGDSLDGRVHVNDQIKISGAPWFGMKVTSSHNNMTMYQGSNPTFVGGYELGVPTVSLPSVAAFASDLRSKAASGGLSLATLNGSSAYYEVEMARSGQYGYLAYRAYCKSGSRYSWTGWTSVRLSNTNGVAWFGSPIRLSGTLDGQLTIGCAGDITITADVLYRDSTPGRGPNAGCDDLLGICASEDVIVANTAANASNCEIHGHVLALNGSFEAENCNQGSPRGDLIVYGGVAQRQGGVVGAFQHGSGVMTSGYNKRYHFDWRLTSWSPPGYPVTGAYILASWTRVPGSQG
jgi:hypothetical protein